MAHSVCSRGDVVSGWSPGLGTRAQPRGMSAWDAGVQPDPPPAASKLSLTPAGSTHSSQADPTLPFGVMWVFNIHGKLQKAVSQGVPALLTSTFFPASWQCSTCSLEAGQKICNTESPPMQPLLSFTCLGRLAPLGTGGNGLSQKVLPGSGTRRGHGAALQWV